MEIITKHEFGAFEARMRKMLNDFKAELNESLVEKRDFYSPKEFAAKTGLTYAAVLMRCRRGKLRAHQDQVNGNWLIDAQELKRLREEADQNCGRY